MGKRILLLTPPYHTGIIEITGKWPPLSIVYLAGSLRQAEHTVEIYDVMTRNHTIKQIVEKVRQDKPEIIMIGAYTASINAALETIHEVKVNFPEIVTVLGGIHASFCIEEIFAKHKGDVDFIVYGEGEITIVELLACLEGHGNLQNVAGIAYKQGTQVMKTAERPLVENLDSLNPAWDLLNWEDYYYRITEERLAVVGSSRGCPYSCKFCSQHKFWCSTYRSRSVEHFVAELRYLRDNFGVKMCMLADEYPTYQPKHWEKLLDKLIEDDLGMHFSLETRADDILRDRNILHKYKQAGIIHIYVGVESAHQEVLDLYNKKSQVETGREAIRLLNEIGIVTECSFIMGHPEETLQSINETLKLAMEFNPDLAHFLLVTPWPYAEIYQELEPYIKERDYAKYHLVHPIIEPINISREELWRQVIQCFAVFYRGKTQQYLSEPDSFKKQYMLRSIKLMHEEFFSNNFGPGKIALPPEITQVLKAAFGNAT